MAGTGYSTRGGGAGGARGFGWAFLDEAGASLPEGGGALIGLAAMSAGWGLSASVVALADVRTPLVGPEGAAPLFAPQKGATPEGVERLARGLDRLAQAMADHGRPELATLPGGGAAGGLGAGLACFARAQLVPGAEGVLSRVGFDAALGKADVVLTGGGSFDRTSLDGKAWGVVGGRAPAAGEGGGAVAGEGAGVVVGGARWSTSARTSRASTPRS